MVNMRTITSHLLHIWYGTPENHYIISSLYSTIDREEGPLHHRLPIWYCIIHLLGDAAMAYDVSSLFYLPSVLLLDNLLQLIFVPLVDGI